ncbi:CubicO group peptidase (beta-lactamase class C family) [Dyella sp. SG562]|uniref:serine hydrolase domain-containing protein n=1 Tax=Dyella sp. SG562 TaxID=2587017 RepID=UPI001ABBBCDA|nr:serine hydrolase domain-containing protein [Dyella sp. SG562]NII74179.1 CubicO group peptidase (beta-lactamase class C family) [Dyella sp. SG562]
MNGSPKLHKQKDGRAGWRLMWAMLALLAAFPALADCDACAATARRFAVDQHFNGVILVGHGSQVDYAESFGVADAATRQPLTADTPFETGSISKWIASIVVMRLVQQGELALDEPISTYLPDYRRDNGDQLTLRELISHASGVPNEIDEAIKRDPATRDLSLSNAEAVRRFASGDLRFVPGTDWDYSHSNWLLVKAVIEQATGRDYASLVDGYLVQPLALRHSGIYRGSSSAVRGMALGYRQLAPQVLPVDKPLPDFMVLAGGFYASANDLFVLMDGLFGGRLLSPESTRTLMSVERPLQNYALGGRTRTLPFDGTDHPVAWEYGSNGAFRVLAWRTLDDGHSVIVMNNTSFDHLKLGELATALMEASYREQRLSRPKK